MSNASSKTLVATKVMDATFAGDGYFSGIRPLAAAAVDTMLKDSIEEEKNCFGVEGDEERMGVRSVLLKRKINHNSSYSLGIFPLW